ncbi:hypothetical protein [Propionivibrio limicola]|uniref:hypothetical protein n=1 Tax=Propionivibrio limicola TaxID=167645 RepID=UPI0012916836|nr:hypothetical protein [Propionivibrio limicola]
MNDSQLNDLRRRIRELLAIPDRDRTDAEWDELNELEIQTAPGNRENSNRYSERTQDKRQGNSGQGRRQDRNQNARPSVNNSGPRQDARPQGDGANPKQEARHPKRQHRRPKKPMGERPTGQQNDSSNSGGATAEVSAAPKPAPDNSAE